MKTMGLVQKIAVLPLLLYKYMISPVLPVACRFTPTCSDYAREAIENHGLTKGISLAVKRLIRCSPFGPSGYDPIPPVPPCHSGSCTGHE